MSSRWVLRTDGGARGNPGPAGAGYVLEDPSGQAVRSGGAFLGEATNNVAEYRALLMGLEVAREQRVTELEVRADSELMVKQLNGVYRVKSAGLAPLHAAAMRALRGFRTARVVHVRRAENHAADEMANAAMDTRGPVGHQPSGGTAAPRLFE